MNGGMGLLLLLSCLILYDIRSILAVGISTPTYLVVEEGMELRLDCTLNYSAHTQIRNIKLEWFHIPYSDAEEESIFIHYLNRSAVVRDSLFTPRLQWMGDIRQKNGSILITKVKCSDRGNFTCDMRIPRMSSSIYRSSTHLTVLCKGIERKRSLRLHESKEVVPKIIILYTTIGVITLFVALFLVITWRKCSMHTAPRGQSRNDPGTLESSEETDHYFTMTRRPPLQRDSENKPMEGKKNKESKTGEDGIYVTMRSFLGTGKPDNHPPIPTILRNPISVEHSHQV